MNLAERPLVAPDLRRGSAGHAPVRHLDAPGVVRTVLHHLAVTAAPAATSATGPASRPSRGDAGCDGTVGGAPAGVGVHRATGVVRRG